MKNFILGILILFLINIISRFLIEYFSIPFPSPLIGMIFLFFLLQIKVIPENIVANSCKFLIKYMGLFFVPLLVASLDFVSELQQNIYSIILIIAISSVVSMIISAKVTDFFIAKKDH